MRFHLTYKEAGEDRVLFSSRKTIERKVVDEKTGEEKTVIEVVDEPVIIKTGWGELPSFFEELIMGMDIDIGKEYELDIPPEKAYGIRDPKSIETVPIKKFRRYIDEGHMEIEGGRRRPRVGDIVYIKYTEDRKSYYGRIVNVSSRAVVIDKNHPLAGKKIHAWFIIDKVVSPSEPKEVRFEVLLKKFFGNVSEYVKFTFLDEKTVELRVDEEYYEKYPVIDRETARKIMGELYIPKILLMATGLKLYSEFGIERIVWIEERNIFKPTQPTPPEVAMVSKESQVAAEGKEQS